MITKIKTDSYENGGGGVEYRYLGGLRMFRDISLFAFN